MVGWGGVQSHFRVKPNSVEVVLRLSWGCDNIAYSSFVQKNICLVFLTFYAVHYCRIFIAMCDLYL